jgi:hypothetical protein
MNKRELKVLLDLYKDYCGAMHSEYDFPGDPWSSARNGEEAARAAEALLREKGFTGPLEDHVL